MNTLPLYAFSAARSAVFTLEYQLLLGLQQLLPGERSRREAHGPELLAEIRGQLQRLLRRDCENIASGLYPLSVLAPEPPASHLLRLPRIVADGVSIYLRRRGGRTAVFEKSEREFFADTPRYYHRNFHFQTGGYLSARSATLYEHQVEMLFGGTADAMRRLIIAPLRRHFGGGTGRGLTFLEIGAGTGRATRFVRLAFPQARIVAVDLSDPYLKAAERNLADCPRVSFLQADGAKLPFRDGQFDAVYSVFLFHELPLEARAQVLAESRRVLKDGGFAGAVDSLQSGDHKAFDPLLESFPKNFHEPFFRNYLAHPLEGLLEAAGFTGIETSTGFFSKVCAARGYNSGR